MLLTVIIVVYNLINVIFSTNQASSIISIFDGHSVTMNHNKSIVSILISHNLFTSNYIQPAKFVLSNILEMQ